MPYRFNPFTANLDYVEFDAGDVVGPSSATDNALVRFDGTTGKLIQNSSGILDDSGSLSGIASIGTPNYIDFDLTPVFSVSEGRLVSGKQLGNDEIAGIKLFPNPVKDELNLEISYDNAKVKIFNATGAIVKEIELNGEKVISVSDLANGLYILSVEDEKGPITETFVKQ